MHLFYGIYGIKKPLPILETVWERLQPLLNACGGTWKVNYRAFPGTECAVAEVTGQGAEGLFDYAENAGRSCLIYGRLSEEQEPARKLLQNTVPSPKIPPELPGCYTAVLSDARENSVWLFTDEGGRRSPKYFVSGDAVMFSSHELPLAAFPNGPRELDKTTIASALTVGWSLSGAPLLRGLETLVPEESLLLTPGRTERLRYPRISFENRVDKGDSEAFAEAMDYLHFAFLRQLTNDAGHGQVDAAQTAGVNSRVILAGLTALGIRPTLYTGGETCSRESLTVAKIARKLGLEHHIVAPKTPTPEVFDHNLSFLSLFFDGITSGKRALSGSLSELGERGLLHGGHGDRPYFGGTGGGILTGFYYPSTGMYKMSLEEATQSRYSALERLPEYRPDGTDVFLKERLHKAFRRVATMSPLPSDWFDLYYYYERFAGRAQLNLRTETAGLYCEPYAQSLVLRAARALPAPLGAHAILFFRMMLTRNLPQLGSVLINGKKLPHLIGRTGMRSRMEERFAAGTAGFTEKVANLGRARSKTCNIDRIRNEIFSTALREPIEQLTGPNTVVAGMLPVGARLGRNFLSGKGTRIEFEVVSMALILEKFTRLLRELS